MQNPGSSKVKYLLFYIFWTQRRFSSKLHNCIVINIYHKEEFQNPGQKFQDLTTFIFVKTSYKFIHISLAYFYIFAIYHSCISLVSESLLSTYYSGTVLDSRYIALKSMSSKILHSVGSQMLEQNIKTFKALPQPLFQNNDIQLLLYLPQSRRQRMTIWIKNPLSLISQYLILYLPGKKFCSNG